MLVILFSRSFLSAPLNPWPDVFPCQLGAWILSPLYPLANHRILSLSFYLSVSLSARPRRLDKSWTVRDRRPIEARCSVDFYYFPSRDLFHFVTPISKVVCRPPAASPRRPIVGSRVGRIGRTGARRERKNFALPTPTRLFRAMVIYETLSWPREPFRLDISYLHLFDLVVCRLRAANRLSALGAAVIDRDEPRR